jgi:hypothetical protein
MDAESTPHLAINVINAHQGTRRISWGFMSDRKQHTIDRACTITQQHARLIFHLFAEMGWHI